jgi:DNA replication protein DnaC
VKDFNIALAMLSDEDITRLEGRYPRIHICPTCNDQGQYVFDGQQHDCGCMMQRQLYKHYLNAGIGVTYQRLDFADYEGDRDVLQSLAKYVENYDRYASRGIGLLLTGPFGTGKTMIANLVLKEFVKQGYRCFATTFAQTIDMLTASWKSPEDRRYFQRRFVDSEILLLDDVGRELRSKSNLTESTFDNILRTRVQEGRPTFITTNMSPEELGEGYGAAILSLLKEHSIVCEMSGEDFRSKSNARTLKEIRDGETRPIC